MKRICCLLLVLALSLSVAPGFCEDSIMSMEQFIFRFTLAGILYDSDHANFSEENLSVDVDELLDSVIIRFPSANCSMYLTMPHNGDAIKEIMVLSPGGDTIAAVDMFLLLYELCYTTGAYAQTQDASAFFEELGILNDFGVGKSGSLDRNGLHYSWGLSSFAGFIFSVSPI